jgi:hypothetical protein
MTTDDDRPNVGDFQELIRSRAERRLPEGSRCGIHGDDTTSGRCATCDGQEATERREYEELTPAERLVYDDKGQRGGTHAECMEAVEAAHGLAGELLDEVDILKAMKP